MKTVIHKLCDEMMQALGPVFHLYKDWEDIRVATCLVMARVIQASPHKGLEQEILTQCNEDIAHALQQFLKLEEEAINAKAAQRDRIRSAVESGIDGFSNLEPAGGHILSDNGPALVGAEPEKETIGPFSGKIAEGGNPGEFGYKVVNGEESPAGAEIKGMGFKTYPDTKVENIQIDKGPSPEDINDVQSANEAEMERGIEEHYDGEQEEAEQARMDTFKEDDYNEDGPRAYL